MTIETRPSSSGQKITLANIEEWANNLTVYTLRQIKPRSPSALRNQDYLQSLRMGNCAVKDFQRLPRLGLRPSGERAGTALTDE
jgi:hypothetical protein